VTSNCIGVVLKDPTPPLLSDPDEVPEAELLFPHAPEPELPLLDPEPPLISPPVKEIAISLN